MQCGMSPWTCYQGLKVDFEFSNLEMTWSLDDCTEGGSKVQPCDAVSHVLTAYKGVPYKKNIRVKLSQY